ncbi:MAG: hypothetical protein QM522_04750 [Chitinophagaceae bacterium]|nr:hypothetical protein [Chitinophagaceae bacterium]
MSGPVITILNPHVCAHLSGGRQCGSAPPERRQGGRWRGAGLNRLLATLIRLLRTDQDNSHQPNSPQHTIDQRNIAINIALHGSSILTAQANGLSLRRSA